MPNEFYAIRVTYYFSSAFDEKHFEVFDALMGNENANLVIGDFNGIEFKVDYTKKES